MIQEIPNFNDLYKKGADIVDVDPSFSAMLFSMLMSETFGTESSYGSIVQNPVWDREYHQRDQDVYIKGRQQYLEFFQDIVQLPYFDYWRHVYGDFDEIHVNINKVSQGGGLPWHFDGYDGTLLQILCYPNMDDFTEEDGGELLVGRPDILWKPGDPMPHWRPETSLDDILTDKVEITQRYTPHRNKIIILNNNDPSFVHKVTELTSDKTRYTVIATLGYSQLWGQNKLKSGYYKETQLL